MGNFEDRLKKLEETFGVNKESRETTRRLQEKRALIFYAEGIRRSDGSWELAETLITQYGSPQSAYAVYRDLDEDSDLERLTKDEEKELYQTKLYLHRVFG